MTEVKKTKRFKVNWSKVILFIMIVAIGVTWHMGIFRPIVDYLNSKELTLTLGKIKLTPFLVLKAIFILTLLLTIFNKLTHMLERVLRRIHHLNASDRSLVIKTISIILYFIAFFIVLGVLGMDLTTISVIGGALGIGIGFGLQKIASNFISGIILLFEKTVNEGDMVELPGTPIGFVKKTSARYTLLESADGREIMVPNEDFITSRVTNYTYSAQIGRMDLDIGVSYDCDPHKVKSIILDVAKKHPLCSRVKEPAVFLLNFGASTLDFRLLFWLDNITDGKFGPTDDILFEIWDKFKENGITFPYPQMDIHIKEFKRGDDGSSGKK